MFKFLVCNVFNVCVVCCLMLLLFVGVCYSQLAFVGLFVGWSWLLLDVVVVTRFVCF